ncbi:hypothetical protein AB2M62_03925 [Sphingomonas sp. MMS12-HWE2-04]|uniref:hypothetical protein n=1 Tax=Sphingomonas sp. MMS12-HWE2-04 TaxID=3234199 RepID=UPI00384F5230
MVVKTALYSDIASRNRPSFYAPPVAWAVAQFTESLIEDTGGILPDQSGMIVASDECSLETVREIANTALQGTISPLRFAGSSPSILVGLPALQRGIRGPSLSLTMRPEHAAPAMLAMIRYWIEHNAITAVIAIAHHRQGKDHLFKGLIARSIDDALTQQIRELGYC